jgi:hypothetical protein
MDIFLYLSIDIPPVADTVKIKGPGICIDPPREVCLTCGLRTSLKCRSSIFSILSFYCRYFLFFVPAFLGLLAGNRQAIAYGWVIYMSIFFVLVLPAVLCSYCPFYRRKGRVIFCISTAGTLKVRKPQAGPIKKADRLIFILGFIVLIIFPFLFLLTDRLFLYAALAAAGLAVFIGSELLFVCSKCVNFDCLMNRVPEELQKKYREEAGRSFIGTQGEV